MTFAVQQSVPADHFSTRVTQDGQIVVHHFVPYLAGMSRIIDADTDHLSAHLVKVGLSLCELAQLLGTPGSPVSAVEEEYDLVALLRRKSEGISLGIRQREIRSGLMSRTCDFCLGVYVQLCPDKDTKSKHQNGYADQNAPEHSRIVQGPKWIVTKNATRNMKAWSGERYTKLKRL